MKLVRYGPAGAEKPGVVDAQGCVRCLSEHVELCKAAQPLALGAPSAQRGHVALDPGLIDEHQPAWIEAIL